MISQISCWVGCHIKHFSVKLRVSAAYSIPVEGAIVILELTVSLFLSLQSYLFLLSSDYERSEWRETIQKLQKKG